MLAWSVPVRVDITRSQWRRIVGEGRAVRAHHRITGRGRTLGAGLDTADDRLAAGVDRDVLDGDLLLTLATVLVDRLLF